MDGRRRAAHRAHGEQREAITRSAWDRFVEPAARALPRPHDPLFALDALAPIDRADDRGSASTSSASPSEERDVLSAELEALAHGYLDDAGAVSVLRWHALSGYSLELTQETGGVYTFGAGTRGLIDAMAAQAPFAQWLSTPVQSIGARAPAGWRCGRARATCCRRARAC